jgi:5-formyltetrahydrofolate cyclo-ligase
MNKSELRKKYKLLRASLSEDEVEDQSLDIANQLLKLDIWDHSFYHIFLSITRHKEVNTEYLLNILSGKDKHIVVSKSDFKDHTMSHFLLTDGTNLLVNNMGIPEPENGLPVEVSAIDVVFVPLLAYDENGHRVGYGKGFYDRFLKSCRPDCLKIGLSFFKAETLISDASKDDIPMDFCVTPNKTYRFNSTF